MKVLIVSQAYPPFPQVGGLRAKKVAEMFRDRGHDVTVVTERMDSDAADVRVNEGRLVVRTVHAGLPYRLRLVALRNRLAGRKVQLSAWDGPASAASHDAADAPEGIISRSTRALRRSLIALLRFPDDQQQFVPPALRLSRELAADGVDILYTTVPAFSTHIVGLMLRRPGMRWVAEFRDPWTTAHRGQHDDASVPLLLRMNRWLERQCLMRADVVVAVTASVGRQLAAKLPAEQRGKIVVSLNGIDRLQPRRVRTEAGQPYRIVYTGSFYHDRDPRPFLDALAAWMRDSGLGTDDVQVDFAGRCRHYANISIEDHVRELHLCDVVRFHDWLSSEAIEDMLRRADLLLLLARSQPAQVPNKLFEYLGMRTPILAVVDEGGESARILNGVGGQFVLAGRDGEVVGADAIRAALESAYARRNEPAATNESALEELLVERQFSHLATALGV